jgi:hypothetical protein
MMKKTLLYAMAATLLAGSGVQAQDEMMIPRWNRFEVGISAGYAYSTPWATLGSIAAQPARGRFAGSPAQGAESISPGGAHIFGAAATYFLRPALGIRLNYNYMPSHIYETEPRDGNNFRPAGGFFGKGDAGEDCGLPPRPEVEGDGCLPLNNHFYDLDIVFRPFLARMGTSPFMGSVYAFLGAGGLTSNYAGGAPDPIASFARRGVELSRRPGRSTVGQGVLGLGADVFSLFGLGFFLEGAVHGYDSPAHVAENAAGDAEDRFAFTPNIKLGVKFGFAPVLPPAPPPPPPPPPMVEAPPVVEAPPAETPIRVCILEAGQLREVDAMVNPTTGDTMAVVGAERRRFREAFPATTGYAAGADFFVQDRPIRFRNRNYVRFGLTRIIPTTDVRPIGDFQGATLFAETAANMQNPDVVYVLVRPGCEFQPYQRETRVTPRG